VGIGAGYASSFGGGLKWDNDEGVAMPSSAGGVYVFFDAAYVEAFVGFNMGGGKFLSADVTYPYAVPDMSRYYINMGLLAKYPITAGNLKMFPLLGVGYEMTLFGKTVADGYGYIFDGDEGRSAAESLDAVWLNIGAGVEADVSESIYLRAELLYGVRPANGFEQDQASIYGAEAREAAGVALKVGVGIRF